MYTLERIQLIIEAFELMYKERKGSIIRAKIKKELEYWYYEKTVIEIINSNKQKSND